MKRILVVDDDSAVLEILTRALSTYEVVVARDGGEAFATGCLSKPDLLITDYMPTLSGDELVGRLRRSWPGLKVLVLTAQGEILDREGPAWWRSEPRLAKPFQLQVLRDTVAALLADEPSSLDAAL
jgi:DNA-binding response OmpR family regulator